MNKLNLIIDSPWSAAVGQTILHSFWQGAGILLLYLLAIKISKNAVQKVWIGLSALFAQLLTSLLTLYYLKPQPLVLEEHSLVFTLNTANSDAGIVSWLNTHSQWFFMAWLIGFAILFFRQLGGMLMISYLQKKGLTSPNAKTLNALNNVIEKWEFELPKFELKGTLKVDTAMVLGFIKPVILIPAHLMTGLSQEQLELIIAHEIAHIKRHDYLLNLAQTMIENLFFYHPAYWYIAHQIRENREHACDDWAAELMGNRILLAKTLAQLQIMNASPSLAMAFGKSRMPLLKRIQYLVGVAPRQDRARFVLVILMISSLFTYGFISTKDKQKSLEPETQKLINVIEPALALPDTNIEVDFRIISDFNDNDYRIKTNNHDIQIDGNSIILDGKVQELTEEQKAVLKKHWKAMHESNKEMAAASKELSKNSKQIQALHEKVMKEINFDPNRDPEFQEKIAKIQKEAEKIQAKSAAFQQKLEKLNVNDKDYHQKMEKLHNDFELDIKVNEEAMRNLEIDMSKFELKMRDFEQKMKMDFEIPAKEIEIDMKVYEGKLDKLSEEFEMHHDAILELLPEDVQIHLGVDAPHPPSHPAKPLPPTPPQRPSTMRPSMPPPPADAPKPPLPPRD